MPFEFLYNVLTASKCHIRFLPHTRPARPALCGNCKAVDGWGLAMNAVCKKLFMLVVFVLLPRLLFAQGTITGTVKDTSGAVLPGVTVEAASPVLIEKVRSAVTDSSGLYRIVDLRPGTYTVTVTLPGFATVKRDGIELIGTATLTIPLEMKVGELQETVTVTGASPVVDVQNTRRETVISADAIQALPATRAYGSLLNAMPGVTVDNNGLAATPTMTFFSAHGGRTNEGRMSINGMTVAAAFNGGGVSSLTYDTNNVEEVSVLVSGGLGENETGGPTMNLVPKSGGNKFSGQAFFNTAGDWSRGDNIDDALRNAGITKGPGIKARTMRAARSAARSSATDSGSSAPTAAIRRRLASRALVSTSTPAIRRIGTT